jgi:hypothetical protein
MKTKMRYWLFGAFLAGFFAIGVPYWLVPYDKMSSPGAFYGGGLLVVTVAAALARTLGKTQLLAAIIAAGAAVPAAVIVRVAVETTGDPTSHNLWPLEVIIALVVGIVSASIGALAGSFPALISGRR